MPASNYKLTVTSTQTLVSNANHMLDRTQALREIGFPLTLEQVMDALLTKDAQDAMELLKTQNVYFTQRNTVTFITPIREGFATRVGVSVRGNNTFPYFIRDESIFFHPEALDDDAQAAFFKWLDDTSTWFRKVEVAKRLVGQFFAGRDGGSMASIHTRWPELAVVPLSMPEPWPTRMRSIPTIRRSEYDWPRDNERIFGWYLDNARKLEIVGAMLAGAQLTGQLKDEGAEVTGRIVAVIDRRQKLAA